MAVLTVTLADQKRATLSPAPSAKPSAKPTVKSIKTDGDSYPKLAKDAPKVRIITGVRGADTAPRPAYVKVDIDFDRTPIVRVFKQDWTLLATFTTEDQAIHWARSHALKIMEPVERKWESAWSDAKPLSGFIGTAKPVTPDNEWTFATITTYVSDCQDALDRAVPLADWT